VGEHVIQHLLELDRRLLRHVVADALREGAPIQGPHGQREQLFRGADARLGLAAPADPRIPGSGAGGGAQLALHPGHHRVEIQQCFARVVTDHPPQRGIRPAAGGIQQLRIERLSVERDQVLRSGFRTPGPQVRHHGVGKAGAKGQGWHPAAHAAQQQRQ